MQLLLATHNPSKRQRYLRLLADLVDWKIVTLSDLKLGKIDEPYANTRDNAIHKARYYAQRTGYPTLAIDEGVTTNFLPAGEQPGTLVRRFRKNGQGELTDEECLTLWAEIFREYPQEDKKFFWEYTIALYSPQKDHVFTKTVTAEMGVTTNFSPVVASGYPMSSFLVPPGYHKPRSEFTEEEHLHFDQEIFGEWLAELPAWLKVVT